MNPGNLARSACLVAGLDAAGLRSVRLHSNAVFLLPSSRVIVRVGGGADALGRAGRAVAATRWLHSVGYPCVVPVPGIEQPIVVVDEDSAEVPVTFWALVDVIDGAEPVAGTQMGHLLKKLHFLRPPFTLPRFRPLDRLTAAVEASGWLAADDRRWIGQRIGELQRQLDDGEFRLGAGMVHGDAQLGNVIAAPAGPVLADWDNVAVAPYEWDLIPADAEQRFGGSPRLLADVLEAYGANPTSDPGWAVLREVYELRSVAAHIRQAPMSPPHRREALIRIASLRAGDRSVRWSAVG